LDALEQNAVSVGPSDTPCFYGTMLFYNSMDCPYLKCFISSHDFKYINYGRENTIGSYLQPLSLPCFLTKKKKKKNKDVNKVFQLS
jgi:hypothetical protein